MGIWTTFSFYEEGSGCEILNENGNGTCCSCDDDQGNRNGTYTKIITQMEILYIENVGQYYFTHLLLRLYRGERESDLDRDLQ